MRTICIVTGSRAEWGLLSGLAKKIAADPELELQIIATNMHLSPEFGLTYREIEQQGFRINRESRNATFFRYSQCNRQICRFSHYRFCRCIRGTETRFDYWYLVTATKYWLQ